jgi:hypothetical protein
MADNQRATRQGYPIALIAGESSLMIRFCPTHQRATHPLPLAETPTMPRHADKSAEKLASRRG